MLGLIVAVIIILIVVFLLLSRIYITCNFTYINKEQNLSITISLFRIRILKREINVSEENKQRTLFEDIEFHSFDMKLKSIFSRIKQINSLLTGILDKTYIHQLKWTSEGGTGEVITTGIASGGIWAAKEVLIGYLIEKSNLKCKPTINVNPNFQTEQQFQTKLDCMLSIKLGQAIHALLKVIREFSAKNDAYVSYSNKKV